MKWGTLYSVQNVTSAAITALVADVLRAAGRSVHTRVSNSGGSLVENQAPAWPHHRTVVHVWGVDDVGKCFIRINHVPPRRVVVLWSAILATIVVSWTLGLARIIEAASDIRETTFSTLLLPSIALASFVLWTLAGLLPTDRLSTELVERMRQELAASGLVLELEPRGHRRWRVWIGVGLIGLVVVTAALGFGLARRTELAPDPSNPLQYVALGVLIVLLVVLVALGALLALAIRRRGPGERLTPALQGLVIALALDFVLAGQFSPWLLGRSDAELWGPFFDAQRALRSNVDPIVVADGRQIERSAVAFAVTRAGLGFAVFLAPCLIMWAIAAALLTMSVRSSDLIVSAASGLRASQSSAYTRVAMAAPGFMRGFRAILIIVWAGMSSLSVFGAGILLVTAVRSISAEPPSAPNAPIGPVIVVAYLLDALRGCEPGTSLTLSRSLWIGSAAMLLGLVGLSVGQLLVQRRKIRALVVRATRSPLSPLQDMLGDDAQRLAEIGSCRAPLILILETVAPQVTAVDCPNKVNRQLILISSSILARLTAQERYALLAHEFAHHIHGDCRANRRLHLLGRCTLVGDAFVGVLEDSFGYELRADRTAVSRFGAAPQALRNGLVKLRAASAVAVLEWAGCSGGLAALPDGTPSGRAPAGLTKTPGMLARLRLAAFLFTSGNRLAYWHPALPERLAQLDRLQAQPNG